MRITAKPHAESRMKDRGITETQIQRVIQNPREVVPVRYGRSAAYGEIKDRKLAVIYEKKDETIEVITALWLMKGG